MDLKLKTDNLSPGLGNDFRNDLIDNFTNTQEAIDQIINRLDSEDTSDFVRTEDLESMLQYLRDKINDDNRELKERINRILLGTDVESIEIVVTQILKQQGVID
jgi:transcription termination factor NusB